MEINTVHALLDTIAQQESDLVFPGFFSGDAWQIGQAIKRAADAAGRKLVISISKGDMLLFFHAMDSIKPINLNWLDRKIRAANMYRCSSFSVGLRQRCSNSTFADAGLDPTRYAGVGGCFPVVVRGCGFVGTIAVSGMEQQEDHQAVVDAVSGFLGVPTVSVLPYFKA